MNDLMDVREALGEPEPPSEAAYAAGRASLLQHAAAARAPVPEQARPAVAQPGLRASRGWQARGLRHRRTGWLAGGLGLTAAAAAAAVVIAGTPGATGPSGHRHAQPHRHTQAEAISQLSGRQILLAAARIAAAAPASTGTYWYLKEAEPTSVSKTAFQAWYSRDGSEYDLLSPGKVFLASPHAGFSIGASSLTYRQIQRLPANPAALTAWITRSFYHPSDQPQTPGGLPHAVYSPPARAEIPGAGADHCSTRYRPRPRSGPQRSAPWRQCRT